MIIELTWKQLQAARQWGTARHKQYLTGNRERLEKGVHAVAMPAVGWRTLADRLYAKAYHPSGRWAQTRMEREGTPGARSALQTIEAALARLWVHPALQRQAVEGDSAEVLVVWPHGERWSPYPVQDYALTILVPVSGIRKFGTFDMKITHWEPDPHFQADIPGLFLADADHTGWYEPVLGVGA